MVFNQAAEDAQASACSRRWPWDRSAVTLQEAGDERLQVGHLRGPRSPRVDRIDRPIRRQLGERTDDGRDASSSSSLPLASRLTRRGSATMSKRVMRGLREANGSWKTSCISWRRSFIVLSSASVTSTRLPSRRVNTTSPLIGPVARRMARPVVVFPQPLSPTRPRVSPSPR